jgi:hypothetical protein
MVQRSTAQQQQQQERFPLTKDHRWSSTKTTTTQRPAAPQQR